MARERSESILADIVATRAERNPDFEVLTFECLKKTDESRTYARLFERGNALAAALIDRGLERGDRFGLFMRNHPEFVEAMIAASITGTVFVPIDARTKGAKLAYTLQNSGSTCVVCADYSLAQLEEVRGELPDIHSVFALESGEDSDAGNGDEDGDGDDGAEPGDGDEAAPALEPPGQEPAPGIESEPESGPPARGEKT